ncbi:MAG: DNA repair exonuclease [Euryarchaeota archaeon]|nr:DNA repair exonuclease [Euryarchaeota archaeon]
MVRIAVLSDFHLGFGWNTPRQEDSFEQALEAIEKSIQEKSDLIILTGDLFDSRLPPPEILIRAMKILSKTLVEKTNAIKIISTSRKNLDEVSQLAFFGIPIFALHGNHERRIKNTINPIQTLESAGFLTHLHCNSILLSLNGTKIALHGMSNVPEHYAKIVLQTWSPKPIENAINILLLHQSIQPYIYSNEEEPTLALEDLPTGFDLIVCGHIHLPIKEKHPKTGTPIVFPGGTLRTQLTEQEAKISKGFFVIDIDKQNKIEFIKLNKLRDFFHETISFNQATPNEVLKTCELKVKELLQRPRENQSKIPLIRLKLTGSLAKGFGKNDVGLHQLIEGYKSHAIISVNKEKLVAPELSEKIKILQEIRERRLSVEEMGLELLKENLTKLGYNGIYDVEKLFALLSEGKTEEALQIVLNDLEKRLDSQLLTSIKQINGVET